MSVPAEPIHRLGDVLRAIGEQLKAMSSGDDIVYRIGGEDEVARNDPANRIVMEPGERTYEAPHGTKVLMTRVETVRMHIWGSTMAVVEELEERLINAIIRVCHWSVRPGTGSWRLKTASTRGLVVIQEMQFLIPIQRRETFAALVFEDAIGMAVDSPS
jgi:hypothetical protein